MKVNLFESYTHQIMKVIPNYSHVFCVGKSRAFPPGSPISVDQKHASND